MSKEYFNLGDGSSLRQNAKQKFFFCGFELAKMHWEFTYTTNSFQDES